MENAGVENEGVEFVNWWGQAVKGWSRHWVELI